MAIVGYMAVGFLWILLGKFVALTLELSLSLWGSHIFFRKEEFFL